MHANELSAYLETYLSTATYSDYAPNGLQVAGRSEIRKICTAVTASLAAIQAAVLLEADALLVHHGFFWKGEAAPIVGMKKARIQALLQPDLNLFAYHLPLDCHLELGNNAYIARTLPLQAIQQHVAMGTPGLLWSGAFEQASSAQQLQAQLTALFGRTAQHIAGGPPAIRRIAWCTGGAQDLIEQAAILGVDAYISGEISERTYYQAQELGIHYFACGHHATERAGIRALGEHLAGQFGVSHQFVDSENPC